MPLSWRACPRLSTAFNLRPFCHGDGKAGGFHTMPALRRGTPVYWTQYTGVPEEMFMAPTRPPIDRLRSLRDAAPLGADSRR
ncbi:hypothetical protein MMUR_07560 [Mycolicibacterium murale]|uniref:Uncharacterized protein n=1 Tax=Mycolicibacterium murale TaxID=182220 RepID=A0A7I9WH36_9MYCO|nr:hypothetical protein MMUR_07560 [Mycolicibacterium murale]